MTKKILITADLGHLKIYRLQEDPKLRRPRVRSIQTEESDVTRHLSEVVTDRADQFRKGSFPVGPNDRSDSEPHNLALERRRRALKTLAKDIGRLITRERVRDWFLAAGKEINGALIAALDKDIRAKIQKNVLANLTKLSSAEVLSHFYGDDTNLANRKREASLRSTETKILHARKKGDYERRKIGDQGRNWNRTDSRLSTLGLNRSNVRRKPSARRTSPFKQMMRKQTISAEVARAMREQPDKGDRRRSVAQRKVTKKARARMAQSRMDR